MNGKPRNMRPANAFRLTICFLLTISIPSLTFSQTESTASPKDAVGKYTLLIEKAPANAVNYVKRGDAYFQLHDFFDAVEDYTTAIEIDPALDEAYFGRGLALGREGFIDEGIADLGVYIQRHPDSSLAYTKRGVRYLWKEDLEHAEKDLQRAVLLDAGNAEAHDDLGVVFSRKHDYERAIEHFSATVRLDPTYQKGYHNLAMALYLSGHDAQSLVAVNQSLALNPRHRASLLLKAEILEATGKPDEAKAIREDAEFLPRGNWSESVKVR